jgi:conjugative relaxase-like TrwC/TraI family protein
MMTLKKLSVGDGYTYLTRHVAAGDSDRVPHQQAGDYYTQPGNPPGQWAGRGAARLGLSGQVTEAQMRHLFGQGMHPEADTVVADYLSRHVTADLTPAQLDALTGKAIRQATLGRRFPVYTTLEDFELRVSTRLNTITAETGRAPTQAEIGQVRSEEARRARGGVAGYDLVFTPVKSLVLLWALDDRQWVRDAVRRAHDEARDAAMQLLEEHAAYTRTGDVGQAQIDTHGLIYAMFDHWDSRDGDPNLHTHVAVSNKIQGIDGKWRSLDGTALYRVAVAASEHYNSALETLAATYLGVDFQPRPDSARKRHPIREVAGMPPEFVRTFSSRRASIEARYEQLVVDFRRAHGRDPDGRAAFALAEQANLDTRTGKTAPRSLSQLRTAWVRRLRDDHGRSAGHRLGAAVASHNPNRAADAIATALSTHDIDTLARLAVARVEESRSTWTVWNLRAEADRLLREPPPTALPHGIAFATTVDRERVLSQVFDTAVAAHCIPVTVNLDLHEPAALRRRDGTSVFVSHTAARYTSQNILDAEHRLVEAGTTPGVTPALPPASVTAVLDEYQAIHRRTLDPGQKAMVVAFATNPNLVAVGIGPAGAGKTTTMHAYHHVLAAHGVRLIPLATSASAAAVLAADLGVGADNVHKFIHCHTHDNLEQGRGAVRRDAFFRVGAGDVILVDEAGLAGTRNLDTLRAIAARHGARLRLLGDYRQLSAVESGGALRLLATDIGATELTHLHRFTDPAEAATTLALRDGDSSALDFYQQRDRIRGGSAQAMIEQAYTAWHTDVTTGHTSIMSAATTEHVTALSARARADRVAAGHVEPDGHTLHDGNLAGRGDWIVTRRNNRTMTCNRGKDWVRNGDAWTVTARHRNGSLKIRHLGHGGTLTLPADYVAKHVELLYATTTHRAQGTTVDTAHALVTADMSREHLYVAATRARLCTTLYATTHRVLPLDEDERLDRTVYDRHARAAREVLEAVLGREGAESSATRATAEAADAAQSLATLLPRLRYTAELIDAQRLAALVDDVLPADASTLVADLSWPTAMRAMRAVESQGWDLRQVLAATARRGSLIGADEPAQLLAWRVRDHIDGRTPAPALAQPAVDDAARYADLVRPLLATAPAFTAADAMTPPCALHIDPVTGSADYRSVLAVVLGEDDASRAAAEPAWPALAAAIRRAEIAGHEPTVAVAQAVVQRPLHDARSLSQTLAYRINRNLTDRPVPTGPHTDGWRSLAWTLKAAENNGTPAEQLLATAPAGTDLHGLRTHLHRLTAPTPAHGVLPWENPLPHVIPAEFAQHIDATRAAVDERIQELTTRALVNRPAWLSGLGSMPTGHTDANAWLRHVSIVAAYRDQYGVILDRADQPLGAYQPEHSAAHEAYLHAASAVLAARHPCLAPTDPVTARIASEIHLTLPDADRTAVAAAIATRLAADWLGPRHCDANTLLTAPAYAAHLRHELIQRGFLCHGHDERRQRRLSATHTTTTAIDQDIQSAPQLLTDPSQGGTDIRIIE